jgi:hypothetical protein
LKIAAATRSSTPIDGVMWPANRESMSLTGPETAAGRALLARRRCALAGDAAGSEQRRLRPETDLWEQLLMVRRKACPRRRGGTFGSLFWPESRLSEMCPNKTYITSTICRFMKA